MDIEKTGDLSQVLTSAAGGDRAAIDQLYGILYPELRALAHQRVRNSNNAVMLDTTSLVHESYLRFVKAGKIAIESHKQFLAYAAHVMRSVVVDYVRHTQAQRRGGKNVHITLDTNLAESIESPVEEIIRVNDLLTELAAVDARLVSVVEMRYFAALGNDEIAECLGVTGRTVRRDLEKVRLLLLDAVG
ncbi:MAG TPA: ECF-type sigma factor [Steroidobacteraceae bacterium]|nr:ECF-type sigma factor [Steroidobacteraceae bacterium]